MNFDRLFLELWTTYPDEREELTRVKKTNALYLIEGSIQIQKEWIEKTEAGIDAIGCTLCEASILLEDLLVKQRKFVQLLELRAKELRKEQLTSLRAQNQ